MAKILVTDGNYPCTLGIVRSLNKQGHKVDCIGEKLCLCRFSKYLNKVSYLKRFYAAILFDKMELEINDEIISSSNVKQHLKSINF